MTDEEAKEPDKTIDELLGEFEAPKPQTEPKSEMGEVVDFVKEFQQKEIQKDINEGISDAVDFIKQDESITGSKRLIKGFLNALAEEKPQLLEAFNNRASNPGAWDAMKKWAQTEAKTEFSTDTKITEDVQAAKAAVSGTTTDEPAPKKVTAADLNPLSDIQFHEYKRQLALDVKPEEALKRVK